MGILMDCFKYTFAILMLMVVSACSSKQSNYDVLETKQIKCPDGAQLEYRPWGNNGLMAVCQIMNGPVAMAEGGHVVVEGENSMGKQHGEWRWMDANGKIERAERY
jgi:hypothetical protein